MATQIFYAKGDKKLQSGSNTSAIVQEFENERDTLETAFQAVRDEIDAGVVPDLSTSSIADLGTKDHDLLTGRGDDDHDLYLNIFGRATGQTVNGGTAASEDLNLQSTGNATKGAVNIGLDDSDVSLGSGASSLGVLGTAPIAKAAAVAALADTTGGTPAPAVVAVPPVGGSGATVAQEGAINDNFASAALKLNEVITKVSAYGFF